LSATRGDQATSATRTQHGQINIAPCHSGVSALNHILSAALGLQLSIELDIALDISSLSLSLNMPKATAGLDHETDYEKIRRENMLSNQKLLQDLMLQKMDCPAGLAAGFAVLGIDEPKPKPKSKPQPKKAVKPKTVVKPKSEDEDGKTVEREGAGARRSARHAGKPTVSYAKDGEEIVDRSKMPRMVSRPDMLWNEDDSDAGEDEEGKVRVNKLVGRVHDP
jgi:hypothetical protein